MSKIIKSQHFIEAHPCRLDPVDVDAFFVNNQEEDDTVQPIPPETEAETAAALEGILETVFFPEESQTEKADEPVELNPENIEASEEDEEDSVADTGPDLFKASLEAEKILDQSKEEAQVLTELAREKADHMTRTAGEEATRIIEAANAEGARIKKEAESSADEIIEKAKDEAGQIINGAKEEAENIIAQARQEAESLKNEAQQQGSETGYQEGLTKAKQEMEQNLTHSINILAQAEEERVRRIAASEGELLKLVTGIAEKVIATELKSHPEQVISVVQEALSRATTANSITVKINPDSLQLLQDNLPSLQEVFSEPKAIAIEADQTILPGDCFIETEHGKVDARIKSQLERIMSEIFKVGRINEPD